MNGYQLHHGDCLDYLGSLPSKGIAIISDVPYGVNLETDYRTNQRGNLTQANDYPAFHGDDKPFDPSLLLRFENLCLWGANYYASKLPDFGGWFVWDKRDGMNSNDQSDCELAWTNRTCAVRIFRHRWNGMIKDSEHGTKRIHPTQKPVALFRWVITQMKIPLDTVIVDPYMGSGSCGVAAAELGYSFVGVEIVEHYYQLAKTRIEGSYKQTLMFPPGNGLDGRDIRESLETAT